MSMSEEETETSQFKKKVLPPPEQGTYYAYMEDNVFTARMYIYKNELNDIDLKDEMFNAFDNVEKDDTGLFITTLVVNSEFFGEFSPKGSSDSYEYTYLSLEKLIDNMQQWSIDSYLHEQEFYKKLQDYARMKRIEIKEMDHIVVRDHLNNKHCLSTERVLKPLSYKQTGITITYQLFELLKYTNKQLNKNKTKKNKTSIFNKIGNLFKRKTKSVKKTTE